MQKSLNQLYKESGTTLSYKEWRKREDEKMASFDGLNIPSPAQQLLQSEGYKQTVNQITNVSGYKTQTSGKTVFGINKTVIIIAGIIIVGAVAYKIYQKNKS